MRFVGRWIYRSRGLLLALAALLLLAVYQSARDAGLRHEQSASASLVRSLGVTVRPLDRELAVELHLPVEARGLIVTSIADAKPAARTGLRPGDLIEEVDGHPVVDARSMAFALAHASDSSVTIHADRGPRELTFRVPRV
ncbi:MAG: PDZ domain-containing protein [Pseudomonadota bacterium]|nr:PDZ domain-containing protein [Pseudomonadota bacterium]